MSQESDACCTTSMYDIQHRCIPDEIELFYFKTYVITHNNNIIEQNINVSTFDFLSVKKLHRNLPRWDESKLAAIYNDQSLPRLGASVA